MWHSAVRGTESEKTRWRHDFEMLSALLALCGDTGASHSMGHEYCALLFSRFKYIYSSHLHDFNMGWYTGIGIEQLPNFIHASLL